jgi:hypothetical protein
MKNIINKLNQVVKLLSFGDFSNRQELLNAYESLKKIFNSPFSSESFPEIMRELKINLFYRQFKLDADPQFLKELVKKLADFTIIEAFLESPEIILSEQEKTILEQRRYTLVSLALLEQDLKEATIPNKEDQRDPDDFFDVYFEDLEKLKEIFSSESISIENINWFFESDLFELISGASDCFDVELTNLYEILLENTEIKTKKDFIAHKQLLEKSQKEKYLDYKEFYAILSKTKKQLAENLRTYPSIPIATSHNISIFKKISNLKKLSPIAKKALINNLKHYKDSPHVNSFKR